jgi:TonB-dependent Receptor Plug Domain/Carboxypeptidase regulatory-like domain
MWTKAALLVVVCVSFVCVPGRAGAQSDTGEIHILVTDADTKKPIADARVLLDGPVIASEITSREGEVDFTEVPDGIYRARIVRRGYQGYSSGQFEVLDGRVVTVTFSLALENDGLKVIASVSSKSSATISTSSITADSAQRRLSDDLAGALSKLSGVTISTSSDDSDATQTISLEGHDASQTQMSVDGIPMNAPGVAGNMRSFASDLFSGASVHLGPVLGGLGGSVNFTTLQPTLSWLSQASISTGSYGRYNWSFAESGSVDKLGVAVQSVYRLSPSLADGDVFLDASGQTYSHDGDADISGNLVKLRYSFGDTNTLTGTFLNSTRDTALICLRVQAPPALPCGFGPGNTSDSSLGMYSLVDDSLVGEMQLQASVFSTSSTNLYDSLDQTVAVYAPPISSSSLEAGAIAASPSPLGYSGSTKSHGFMMNATLPAKARHTISVQAYSVGSTNVTTPLVPEAQLYYNQSLQTSYSALQATDAIHSNDKLQLAESFGLSSATGAGASLLASSGATWNPNRRDSFAASYAIGGAAATIGRQTILSAPTQLRFNCSDGGVAFGQAPGEEPGRSSSVSVRAGYTRNLPGGNVSLTLYRQVQSGVLLPIYVNGTELESLFPAGYLQQIEDLYDSPAGCNKPNVPFTAAQLYFQTPISGVARIYEGAELTSYLTLGRLVVQPFYNLTGSKADASSVYFDNPYSFVVPGDQLPNVPLHRAGITLDYKAPHSIFEWLADAQYTSSNNWQNLPSYTTFDAGVTAQLTTGTLTLAATNVTNAFAGIFSGPANAVPYVTTSGKIVPTIAVPLQPRSYSVTYSLKFGQAATTQTASAFMPRRGGGTFGGPGGPPPGGEASAGPQGAGGRGGFARMFSPLPTSPPSQPFAVAADPQTCSADNAAKARQIAGELGAYAARIEAAKTSVGYPPSMPAPESTDATIVYHGLRSTYALAITPKAPGAMRAFAGCMSVHVARADDVTSRKLYAPSTTLFMVPQLNFMPAVGMYIVARQPQAGQEQFRMYQLPANPPSDPFQLRPPGGSCTQEAHDLATSALGELRAYFERGASTPTWTITAHAAKSGAWYELQPGDPTTIPALLQCGRIAVATPDQLSQRGFAGEAAPELNYAKALGLYFLRPARPAPRASSSPSPQP